MKTFAASCFVLLILCGPALAESEWSTRSSSGEYRSTSSLPLVPGATAELGTTNGPRLAVRVQ
jgi:hypothetical protein